MDKHEIRIISFRKATRAGSPHLLRSDRKLIGERLIQRQTLKVKRFRASEAQMMKHIVRGIVRHGLKPLPSKASISLRIDADVLEWFKAQGPGYQTRMNLVLRAYRDASI